MTELSVNASASAKAIFGDYPQVAGGEATPVQLKKQIAGLDAYRLSLKSDKKGVEITRIPVHKGITVEWIAKTEGQSQSPQDHSFLISFTEDQDKMRAEKVEEVAKKDINDYSSGPGRYEIVPYGARFGPHSSEGDILSSLQSLVELVKEQPMSIYINYVSYAKNILRSAAAQGRAELEVEKQRIEMARKKREEKESKAQ